MRACNGIVKENLVTKTLRIGHKKSGPWLKKTEGFRGKKLNKLRDKE
jgi:hypothetical protein